MLLALLLAVVVRVVVGEAWGNARASERKVLCRNGLAWSEGESSPPTPQLRGGSEGVPQGGWRGLHGEGRGGN